MSQVQYGRGRKETMKVWFSGSETVPAGGAVCFDRTAGTASEQDEARGFNVVRPATANFGNFAGIVTEKSGGKVGPAFIEIYVPTQRGFQVPALVEANSTIDSTTLGLVNDEFHLATGSAFRVARAMQTKNDSSAAATQQVELLGVGLGTSDA